MASLYRTYRPQRFSELVGQDHVTTALRNAVVEDRVGHAYLFSGPRGTGKTTSARLLARALNCLALAADGEPCGTCENCVSAAHGTFNDLVELDAASNRSIEDMRSLIRSVHLGLGATSKRRVYIIDEVHMLQDAAANTLLKTIEEPPAHVVFVLATTDPQKVLATIRSRTQHFDFALLSSEQLIGHMADILDREGIPSDSAVLELVARRAAGSARDALSALDQVLALGGGKLDSDAAQSALGGAPFDLRVAVLEAAVSEDVAGALGALHDMLAQGHDVRRVADSLLRTLRDAFMCANAGGRVPYDGPREEAEHLATLARTAGNAALTRAIEVFGQTIIDIRAQTVADPRLVLEVAVVRVARRETRSSVETLLDRVERLERQLAGTAPTGTTQVEPVVAAPAVTPTPPVASAPKIASKRGADQAGPMLASRPASRPDAPPKIEVAVPEVVVAPVGPEPVFDLDDVIEAWPRALDALSAPLRSVIQVAQPIGVEDGIIVFGVPRVRFDATNTRFRKESEAIKAAFGAQLGFQPRFMLRPHDFETHDALAPVAAAAEPEHLHIEDEAPIELADLVDAPAGAEPPGAADRLISDLGAQIVEERNRD